MKSSIIEYLDRPAYAPVYTGKLIGLHPARVRRWLRGYSYESHIAVKSNGKRKSKKQPSVIKRGVAKDSIYASFLDLIDLLFVRSFIEHGISLQKLRRALREAELIIGGHHFAQRKFFTDGRNIYLEVKEEGSAIKELLSGGQWVIAPIIKKISTQIDFSAVHGFAERWYPLGEDELIVIDPLKAFGSPCLKDKNMKTSTIYDLYIAENENLEKVCGWLSIDNDEAKSAIEFEQRLKLQ